MDGIQYGPARPGDIIFIQAAAALSWASAYGHIFTEGFIARFLEASYSTEMLQRAIRSPRTRIIVARDGGQIAGFSHFGDRGGAAELFRLYVIPTHWRKGIGGRLLELTEASLRARRVSNYVCFVHRRNPIGRSFYRKRNFLRMPERDRKDELCLMRTLTVDVARN